MATLLKRQGAGVERVAPVRELFQHISEAREVYAALVASEKVRDVLELGQGFFARSIEERLLLAGVTTQEDLPGRQQTHEQRGIGLSEHLFQRVCELGIELEAESRATVAECGRAGTIGWQRQRGGADRPS